MQAAARISSPGSGFVVEPHQLRAVVAPELRTLAAGVKAVGNEVRRIRLSDSQAGHPLAAEAVQWFTRTAAQKTDTLSTVVGGWAGHAESAAGLYAVADDESAADYRSLLVPAAATSGGPAPAAPAPAAVPATGVGVPVPSTNSAPSGEPAAGAACGVPGAADTGITSVRSGLGLGFGMGPTYSVSVNPATGSFHLMLLVPFPTPVGPGLWQTFLDRFPPCAPAPAEGVGSGRVDVVLGVANGVASLTGAAQLYPDQVGVVVPGFALPGLPGTQMVTIWDQQGNITNLFGVNNGGVATSPGAYGGVTYTVPVTVSDRTVEAWLAAIERGAIAAGKDIAETIGKAPPAIGWGGT